MINYEQKENRFNYILTNKSIGQTETIFVIASTPESDYINEDSAGIDLTVLPKK